MNSNALLAGIARMDNENTKVQTTCISWSFHLHTNTCAKKKQQLRYHSQQQS